MKRYLILGGSGQLGQALKKVKHADVELIYPSKRVEITNFEQVRDIIVEVMPDAVINCAAYTAVDKAEDNVQLAIDVNAYGAANIAKVCADLLIDMVHISTDYVFDGNFPGIEGAKTNPLNVYGYSKLFGEQLVMAVHPTALIIRTASVYSEFGNNFLKSLLSRYNAGQREFEVVCDQFSCPTYAPALADTILTLLEYGVGGRILHYAGKDYVSWHTFAEAIFSQVDPTVKVKAIPASVYNSRATRPAKSYLETKEMLKPEEMGIGITETLNVLLNKERK
jgi:dTDP-4-dehydrorhamnose reductase|nr:MAG TPA: dTDP-4-dehydrorhamnose reductase [Caudoviricetes sp.]